MNAELLARINWKTTGLGVLFIACSILGNVWEQAEAVCKIIETLIVGGGFISAADSSRVQNVVRAVDALLYKNQLDPETLHPAVAPIVLPPATPDTRTFADVRRE